MTREEIKKQTLDVAYKNLETAYNEKNYFSMLSCLNIILKYTLQKRDFVFHCLYVLAKNDYHKEVKKLLPMIKLIRKNEQPYLQIIENTIANREIFLAFTKEQKEAYNTAIEKARRCYQIQNLTDAYEIYKEGYEKTHHPIFLYYLGKIMYKKDNFNEAMNYLFEYIKLGDEKVSKAYLFLIAMYCKKWDYKTAQKYVYMYDIAGKLFLNSIEITGVYDKDDEEIDVLKLKIQNIESGQNYIFKRKQPKDN